MSSENRLMKTQSTKTALKPILKEIYIFMSDRALTTQKAILCIPYKVNYQISHVFSTEMLNWHSFSLKNHENNNNKKNLQK